MNANALPAFTLHLTSIKGRAKHRQAPTLYRNGDASALAEGGGGFGQPGAAEYI